MVDVCDYENSPYLTKKADNESKINRIYYGDFNRVSIDGKYDLVWASHVLEHQLNIQSFLEKAVSLVSEGGYIALIVPPRKPFIVSGHVNLFNPGLLVYKVGLAGVDCSKAKIIQYDGNICLVVKVKIISALDLKYDIGDIESLSKYFPIVVREGFNGDFMYCNLTQEELDYMCLGCPPPLKSDTV